MVGMYMVHMGLKNLFYMGWCLTFVVAFFLLICRKNVPKVSQMGSGGPRWALAGRGAATAGFSGGGGDDQAGCGDGGVAASLLQRGGRSFTGPDGPGRAREGLVCSSCSVRSMTASRRWR